MDDLRQLPRFEDSLSFLYIEHARIEQDSSAVAVHTDDGDVPVPAASLAVLMLGPGTTITHAAVRALADNNCLVVWAGRQGDYFYAHGMGGTRSSAALLHQARLASDPESRLAVVMRMYRKRLGPLEPGLTIEQIRGKEGIRVREAYARASRETGVPWKGRCYSGRSWAQMDTANRTLSVANAALYALVHAAMLSAGYSPAIGFIHTGKQLSFVYDIADLYKAELTIPIAFEAAASITADHEKLTRILCRERFRSARLMQRIIPDIREMLAWQPDETDQLAEQLDEDPRRPGGLWGPGVDTTASQTPGGVNYGGDDSGEGQSRPQG